MARRRFVVNHPDGPKERLDAPPGASTEDRFWIKVGDRSDCWLWIGAIDQNGYGLFRAEGQARAHRWAYLRWRGPIPEGLTLDHLCRTKACVNPFHLEAVTRSENARRGRQSSARFAA